MRGAGPTAICLPITTPNGACRNNDLRAFGKKLVLDGFQAGLSWITILRKTRRLSRRLREGFDPRASPAGANGDRPRPAKPGIVRHRGKIEAAVTGAAPILDRGAEGFRPSSGPLSGPPIQNRLTSMAEVQAKDPESEAMSKALKSKASSSAARSSPMPSCRPAGWSTTMTHCPQHARVRALSPAG